MRPVTPRNRKTLGFALYNPTFAGIAAGDGTDIMRFESADNTVLMSIRFNDVGVVRAMVGSTPVGASSRVLVPAAWHYIEVEWDGADVGGRIRLILDGEEQFIYSGDTLGAALVCEKITIPQPVSSGLRVYDDMYCIDDTAQALGESQIYLEEAVSDYSVQFTPSTGSVNYANIDDVSADSDTTYNSSNTPGHVDLFNFSDITVNPETIHCLGIVMAARKEDSATRTICNTIVSGAVPQDGDNFNLTTTYLWKRDYYQVDPATGLEWTKDGLNGSVRGYKLVA